jgi:steroid 5-alpha reductase family enzyme
LAFAGGWIAFLGQAIILASIFGVTGISPTERQAIQSKREAYRQYQRRVSNFVPMPPT